MQTTVNQLLTLKGHEVWTVNPGTGVFEALQLMADKNIGALPVLDNGGLCGIVSERDYARKIGLTGRSLYTTLVSDIMTKSVLVVRPEQSIDECMALMTEKHHRHFPVIDNHELVGIISIGDVVKAVISDQAFLLGQLSSYIAGSSPSVSA
ncbi:MAG: CBS domain-containing protein [Chloroflexi bacterium]|nr:CBS domain-containing protein [Chloroflexota bacterium]